MKHLKDNEHSRIIESDNLPDIQIFRKDVEAGGPVTTKLLNNRSLATEYLTTNTEQTLSNAMVLGEAATAEVDVHGTVNAWRIQEEVAATMKVRSCLCLHIGLKFT